MSNLPNWASVGLEIEFNCYLFPKCKGTVIQVIQGYGQTKIIMNGVSIHGENFRDYTFNITDIIDESVVIVNNVDNVVGKTETDNLIDNYKDNKKILNTHSNPVNSLKNMLDESITKSIEETRTIGYDTRFCRCGTIHFVEEELINCAITVNKEIIVICGSCGKSFIVGAEIDFDYEENNSKKVYSMYSHDFNTSFTTTLDEGYVISDEGATRVFSANPVIRYSMGKKPLMLSGGRADYYNNSKFYDSRLWDSSYLDSSMSKVELAKYTENRNKMAKIINMTKLLTEFNHSELISLSKYSLEGFNWRGTKYEKDYDSK